jgi:hypothetical protein
MYQEHILPEDKVRELARTEPWRSLWVLKESDTFNMFHNADRELSINQKNLLVWSNMYDNIQESTECPPDSVINDDYMLDGWFLIQKKQRDKDKSEADFESGTSSEKIKNANEVFLPAKTKDDIQRISDMNDMKSKMVKKQRNEVIKEKESVTQQELPDERQRIQQMANQALKDKFRR